MDQDELIKGLNNVFRKLRKEGTEYAKVWLEKDNEKMFNLNVQYFEDVIYRSDESYQISQALTRDFPGAFKRVWGITMRDPAKAFRVKKDMIVYKPNVCKY